MNRPKNISDKHLLSSPLTLSWEGEPEWPLPRVEELAVWTVVELWRASVWLVEGACVCDADFEADTWVVLLLGEELEWTAAVVALVSVCGGFSDVAGAVECVSGWFNCVTDVFVDGVVVAVMFSGCVSSCCAGLVAVELGWASVVEVAFTAGGLGGCDVTGLLTVVLVPAERNRHSKCTKEPCRKIQEVRESTDSNGNKHIFK